MKEDVNEQDNVTGGKTFLNGKKQWEQTSSTSEPCNIFGENGII